LARRMKTSGKGKGMGRRSAQKFLCKEGHRSFFPSPDLKKFGGGEKKRTFSEREGPSRRGHPLVGVKNDRPGRNGAKPNG